MVTVGDRSKVYFVGEIGINHNGDLSIAKRLMDAVFACQWHCAKFQKRTPDICIPREQWEVMRDTPWGRMRYIDYKRRVEFEQQEYDAIAEYARQKPLDWTASVWDLPSLKFLVQFEVPFVKIPSAMLTNLDLLREAAASGLRVVLSTGMSTWEEVDQAVNLVMANGSDPIVMHTNSSYPTPRDELNLLMIPALAERYGCPIGYSGHEQDLEPTVIAVALGACVVERHITLSHDMWGTDQAASLEVHGMNMLRLRANDVGKMLGKADKFVTPSEIPIREKLREAGRIEASL